jgi:glycine betaine catabolism A
VDAQRQAEPQSRLDAQLQAADDVPLDRSLPGPSYVAEAEFAREREAVLFADWFCVGRADSVAAPGDYLTVSVAGESIIVCRTQSGALAAFYNVCRHRGSRLVPPGQCQPAAEQGPTGSFSGAIRCPYHGWSYGLDGTLRTAPFLADLRPYRSRLSLHRVQAGEWGGFAFVRLGAAPADTPAPANRPARADSPAPAGGPGSASGPSLQASVQAVASRLAAYPLAELRTGRRISYQVAANWKVILENYNECYHCGPVHPELCDLVPAFRRGGGDLDWEAGIPHRDGAYTFTVTGITNRAPFPGLSEEERGRHKGELILPNLMLSLSSDHVAAFTVWPRSAEHTTVVCDFLFHPAELARPEFDPSDAVEFWDLVNRQDWSICEQVQDGMRSRAFSVGYLAPMEQDSADVGRHVARRLHGE